MNTLENYFGVRDEFGESLDAIKKTSRLLRPFGYPNAQGWDETIVEPLREAAVELDDYLIEIYYASSQYDKFILDYIKLAGSDMPMLPTRLVCDVGHRTFTQEHLGYFTKIVSDRRYYWWFQAKDFEGKPIPLPFAQDDPVVQSYGLEYTDISPQNMRLY